MNQKSIPYFFEESVFKYSNNPLLKEKRKNAYESTNYKQTKEIVYNLSAGLISIGLKNGDRVALISEGRNDWIISELAILYAGAINVPLSVKLIEPEEIAFRINHSDSKFIIVSENQATKIKELILLCPNVEKIIYLDEQSQYNENEIFKDDIIDLGKKYLEKNKIEFENIWKNINNDDIANICYTSGTTAEPKGIMLSHRNYTANVEQAYTLMDIPETYCTLFILPLDHSFAHTVFYCFIGKGASIAFTQSGKSPTETLKNIPINIKEVKPNLILSVPALAKNFKKNIEKNIIEKGFFASVLFKIALFIGYYYNAEGWNKGNSIRFVVKPLLNLMDNIIFSKIRNGFGGNLDFFIGGGALLDIELQKFFYIIGIPMLQGYGLSEASPIISSNSLKRHKLGSSGQIVKPLELKIIDENGNYLEPNKQGEIAIKGENVMKGYWKNPMITNETIKNNWLYTGDLGYTDNEGFLYVIGRFKSLLISSDGEKYSPEGIEESITEYIQFVEQIMLYNNQNPYTCAIIVLNNEKVIKWFNKHLSSKNIDNKKLINQFIKQLNHEIININSNSNLKVKFPNRWLPTSFVIIEEPFSENNRLLNSTLKMVRNKIIARYQHLIDFMYTSEGKDILNDTNIKSIKNIFEKN